MKGAGSKMKPFKTTGRNRKKCVIVTILAALIVGCITTLALTLLSRVNYELVSAPFFEVNSEHMIDSLFSQIDREVIKNKDTKLDTSEVGEKHQNVILVNRFGAEQTIDVLYQVNDTIAPEIIGENELSFEASGDIDILANYKADDNSRKDAELLIEGNYDTLKAGDYTIKIIATDPSGNTSSKEVRLTITEPPRAATNVRQNVGSPYYIEVNRQQNVVIVYKRSSNNSYSDIVKVFVASTGAPGSETPLGIFTTSDRYETLFLVGNVWGHYTMRINGPIFFHSVPYFSKGAPWDNLEYLEYNKLGNGASAGCVRLAASDAKWIYDNVPYGTTVKIYDSPSLPVGVTKPSPIKIDENSPNRGWDPTDPDPNNPWR